MFTCKGCDNTWTALQAAHCSVCHNLYSRVSNFDKHRSHGKCLDPETVGMVLRTSGTSPVWAMQGEPDVVERFKKI